MTATPPPKTTSKRGKNMKYYCNPLNLPYQYQLSVRDGVDTAFREAADPSLVLFQGKYWLFPSMTGGFFTSTDLCDWEFHPFTEEIPIHDYAPDVCVIDGALWFSASRQNKSKDN